LGTVDGELVGLFMKAAVKGLIWYNPQVWQAEGFQEPGTWQDLVTLSTEMAGAGGETKPWCIAVESQAASGWPGTDWIEDIVLRQAGPDVYRQWYSGELEWTSDEIRQAWETWGELIGQPDEMIYGGVNRVLTTNFGNVGDPLFTDPPGCYMAHQASFIADFFVQNNPDLQPIEDFAFFPFPAFEANAPDSMVSGGDILAMFNDTPQARALMRYLAQPEAQAIWAARGGGYLSPNRALPNSVYPDELSQLVAERLTSVEQAVFDASDQMPQAMNDAFWQGILNFIQDPASLDSVLEELESVRQSAYQN
jgi:alpha-glucoside transport system substrate-binding protein